MRPDVVDLLTSLHGVHAAELQRVVAAADLEGDPPAPEPDVVEPYRWFLERLGSGVQLTAAGYLPPALVGETMRALGWDAEWIGAATREDTTRPVAELRDTARRLGLVRVHRRSLVPTREGRRLAEDPVGLWWHLAARLPLAREHTDKVAGLLWLLGVAAGRPRPETVVVRGLAQLGWVNAGTGRPLGDLEAFSAIRDTTWTVFDRLGVLGRRRLTDDVPTAAAVALARAALLHEESPPPARVVPAIELTVTLRDVDPPVWRRLAVPERASLHDLDELLRAGMGWRGGHLSVTELDGRSYGYAEDLEEMGDPRHVRLASLPDGTAIRWVYDLGDGWEHDVRIEGRRTAEAPICLDGGGACPPDDCGGPAGYERLRRILADPRHPEHADARDWLARPLDPDRFDPVEVTRRLRNRRMGARR